MCGMAVQIDLDAVRDAVQPPVLRTAEKWLADGSVGIISGEGGGACAVVDSTLVWVGIVDRAFVAECDCAGTVPSGTDVADGDELCAHAVALVLAATAGGFAWSSSAVPPSQAAVDPAVRRLTAIAATLPARRLAALVGEYAASDRKLEARLLAHAGRLGAPTDRELAEVRATIDGIVAEATRGRWGLEDLARAGRLIVDEVEVLVQRPPAEGTLVLVEDVARQWDELSVHLHGAYFDRSFEEDPEEIGAALLALHVRLCEQLDVDPDELVDRLKDIIGAAEITSCLDAPEEYAAVLGPELMAELGRHRY